MSIYVNKRTNYNYKLLSGVQIFVQKCFLWFFSVDILLVQAVNETHTQHICAHQHQHHCSTLKLGLGRFNPSYICPIFAVVSSKVCFWDFMIHCLFSDNGEMSVFNDAWIIHSVHGTLADISNVVTVHNIRQLKWEMKHNGLSQWKTNEEN